jgi:hypothetical protein
MNRRVTLLAVVLACVVLAAALVIGAVGCGGGGTTTTAAPATTTTAAAPATTATSAATATTAAGATGSSTAGSLPATAELDKYKTDMLGFAQELLALPTTGDPSKFTDLSKITDADVQAATAYVGVIHSAFDKLKAIKPPAEFAAAHQKIVDGISKLVDATDKLMAAIVKKDAAAFAAAQKDGEAIATELQGLMQQLGPLFGLGTTPAS